MSVRLPLRVSKLFELLRQAFTVEIRRLCANAMAGGGVHAERLSEGAEDPEHPGRDCSEEDEVERSYKENYAGNAQAVVEDFMNNMDFLQREGDLIYVVPKGTACMHMQ